MKIKKITAIILIFVTAFIFTVFTGCDDKNGANNADLSNDSGSNSQNAVTLKGAITPAAGWELKDADALYPTYVKNDGSGANITLVDTYVSTTYKTLEDYVAYAQDNIKASFSDFSLISKTNTTVGGMDAVDCVYTTTVMGMLFTYRTVYMYKDNTIYTIACTCLDEDYAVLSADYQSMIDSYTLK